MNSQKPRIRTRKNADPLTFFPQGGNAKAQAQMELPEGTFQLGDELESELAEAIDSVLESSSRRSRTTAPEAALSCDSDGPAATRELFLEIASSYSQPIKDLIFEYRRGSAGREWIEYCRPALKAILNGVRQFELPVSSLRSLEKFDATLGEAETLLSSILPESFRLRVLQEFGQMNLALPQIFSMSQDYSNRERIVLEALLYQIPGVSCGTIKKLAAAGLLSLDRLFAARAEEIRAVTGTPMSKCRMICRQFQQHKEWVGNIPPEKRESILKEKIQALAVLLDEGIPKRGKKKNEGTLSKSPTFLLTKREKHNTILQIRLLLAELHRIDLAEWIHKGRVSKLLKCLDQLKAA